MTDFNRTLNKRTFLNAIACQTAGWRTHHKISSDLSLADRFRMQEGVEVHEHARLLHSDHLLIDTPNLALAAERTAEALADSDLAVVCEAAFVDSAFGARADMLVRQPGGWELCEVKSSLNDKSEFIDDLAYTLMVLRRCVVPVTQCTLVLMSRDYRRGMSPESMFITIDHTDEVMKRADEFEMLADSIATAVASESMPETDLNFACRQCEYFGTLCHGSDAEHHIFELPRISEKRFNELMAHGVTEIGKIPDSVSLTDNQEVVRAAVVNGETLLQAELAGILDDVVWPAIYLDFETVTTALPLYNDIGPHVQIPTQYSVHICSGPGKVVEHREFLADATRDCRAELVDQLINDLAGEGSIICYSSFEKTTLNGLAKLFPAKANALQACVDRLFDLEVVFKKGYYHPGFCGSTSIKKTLPVLVPDMTYSDLEVGDGETAVAVFAGMARGEITGDEAKAARDNLLRYCKQDTLAMVRLHERVLAEV